MRKKLRTAYLSLSLLGVLILSQACSRSLDPEPPCNFVQSTQLQRVSWKSAADNNWPIELMVHASVPSESHPALEAAIAHWNKITRESVGEEAFKVEIWGVGGPTAPSQDFNNVIYWMSDWEPDLFKQQARTTIFWSGSRINEADIRINGKNFTFDFTVDPLQIESTKVDFQSLMIHELGHVLGMAHNGDKESVMQKSLEEGKDRRTVNEVDVNSVKCEYQ